ncbi:MAG: dipeptide epimerase [Candidatus Stahlbacteria bacterium]|nr:dipeptide epimerase [Candidatus Stahlbacteria bacterium]
MKIANILFKPITLPLKRPFKIALGTDFEYVGVVVQIETDVGDSEESGKGITGLGESSPSARITGETIGTVMEILNTKIKPVLIGKNPLQIEQIMDEIHSVILHHPSAKCAIDIALHDILGKYANLPLYQLLGGYKDEIITSITIGIKSIEETIDEAQELLSAGAKVIKIKIGLEPQEDIDKIKALREAIGYNVKIRVDANQGYTATDAIKVINKIEQYEIEFVEQPLPYWDIQGLKRVKNKVGTRIMVDESLHSTHDAINLIRANACDMFNIKLMKAGGIMEAKKICSIAEGAGIPCMLGCMVETRIGVSAATHLALGMKNILYADLDGHILLGADVCEGGVITTNGTNRVTNKTGLGVQLTTNLF